MTLNGQETYKKYNFYDADFLFFTYIIMLWM